MNIYPVIVIYNKKCSESFSCKALIELGYEPTIVDNSTADYGNAEFCSTRGLRYVSMHGNVGLPKAYNAAIDLIKHIDDGSGFMLWFDDDTEIEEEYFRELKDSIVNHPEADIFVPVVYSIDKPGEIISPCVQIGDTDRRLRAINRSELDELFNNNKGSINKTEADSAINSGMCVRLKIYDDCRYDENMFLDWVDHDFMYSVAEKGIKTYILRQACLYQHMFFHNKWATKKSVKTREKIYNYDFKYYVKKTGIYEYTTHEHKRISVKDILYRCLFPIYKRLTTSRFKKVYRNIKCRLTKTDCIDNSKCEDNNDCVENNYIILSNDCGLIGGYLLADIETAERIYLMRSKKIKKLPYFVIYRVMLVQLKKALKALQHLKGRVLLADDVLQYVDAGLLNVMKNNGCELMLLITDPVNAEYPSVTKAREMSKVFTFDKVFTSDRLDAEKYGFEYVNTLYSVPAPVMQNADIKYDLFCCRNIKYRKEAFEHLYNAASGNSVALDLLISGDNADRFIPYEDVAERLQRSNCILDINQDGHSGVMLRYYEAVVYNRKLLTNNKRIVDMPFYNDKYMKIYDDISDIDWDWVKKREPIDYRYHGEFSPNYADFFAI